MIDTHTGARLATAPGTQTETQPAETPNAETNPELDAWVETMLKKMDEFERRNPGWYEQQKKFWDEVGYSEYDS